MAILVGRSAVLITALFMTSILMVSIPGYSNGDAPYLVSRTNSEVVKIGNWTVTGIESYSSSNITLSGNLTIDGTLILDNVNLFLNGSGKTLSEINISGGGILRVTNNSMISGLDSKQYYFRAMSGSIVNMIDTSINGCGVLHGEPWRTGIGVETIFFNMTDCDIDESNNGLVLDGGSAVLRSVQISSMAGSGLLLLGGSSVRTSWVNFTRCFTTGIQVHGSTADVADSIFDSCFVAVDSHSSEIKMSGSLITSISHEAIILNSTDMDIIDSYLPVPGNDMVSILEPAGNSSNLYLLNTTLGNLLIVDPGAIALETYRHDFKVLTNGRQPADAARLTIKNRDDDIESLLVIDSSGTVLDHPVIRYSFDASGSSEMEPHNLTVEYQGATRYMDFSTLQSYSETIHVILTAPVVDISDPIHNSWIATSSLSITGTVDDQRTIVDIDYILNNLGPAKIIPANKFMVNLTIPDGEHKITIIAENDDGNTGFDMIDFGIDTVFPTIAVDRSIIPSYTNGSEVRIRGTCNEAEAKVFIGDDMAPHPDGTFNRSYLLEEGRNEILVKAVDRAGNTAETTVVVVKDTIPPPIHVRSFLNGSRVRGESIWVNGTTDLDTQRILVNGEYVPFTGDAFSYLLSGLVEGGNVIRVTAVDMTGSTSTWVGTVVVDNTPPDLIVFDLPAATNLQSFRLRGRTEPGSRVLVNGFVADVAADEWSIVIDLFPGINPIHISAYDDLDNGIELNHMIVFDESQPVIDNIQPLPGSTIRNPALTLQISIYDENGLSLVRGKIGGGDFRNLVEGDPWEWTVSLKIGTNNLTLEVVDLAGNTVYRDFTYLYYPKSEEDNELPTVSINTPESGSKHSPGNINIEGEAYDNIRIDIIQIRINGTEWRQIEGSTVWHYLFNFSRGMNSIEVRAVDESGNVGNITMISILVVESDENSSSDGSKLWLILSIVGAIIFLLLCLVLVYTFISYNRLKMVQEEGDGETEMEPRSARGRPAPIVGRDRDAGRVEDRRPGGARRRRSDLSDDDDVIRPRKRKSREDRTGRDRD